MVIDLGTGGPSELQADFAVIGAGAAGLTMARRLIEGGRSVILLESGGLDYESQSADLNRGEVSGEPYYPLHDTRLRFFGGTTAIWGGRSAELDPIDFERREWVEWSGWPFGHEELRPWYRQARQLLELPADRPDFPNGFLDRLDERELANRYWLIDTRFDRFGPRRNSDLLEHPRLTLVLHATAREIIPAGSGEAVARIDVRGPGDRRLDVRAGTYVLAAGGLENPRILLASNSVVPNGIGNEHDLVGRFFMEHPHGRGGRITGASSWPILRAFQKHRVEGQEAAALLAASPLLQRQKAILNSALTIAVRPPVNGRQPLISAGYLAARHHMAPTERGRMLWKTYKAVGRSIRPWTGPFFWWASQKAGRDLAIVLRAEQAPNPDSRVTLTKEVDSTGMPRIHLQWRLSPQDISSAAELVSSFARELTRLGIGRVEPADWLSNGNGSWVSDRLVSVHPLGGYHHMGTTRMADSPRRGVTDGWGRVHGISNLYIAGSSLFPTSGWANPTLTILALALRQADHLLNKSAA